jgi:hypothetical protein
MYHYLGRLRLYEASRSSRTTPISSGFRCPCKVGDEYWDCIVDFISESEISPGEATDVRLSFVSIIHVAAFLAWGDVRHAVVDRIGWTQARLLIDGCIVAHLSSEDVGLRLSDEIGQTLHCGDAVTVRVERIDRDTRSIKIRLLRGQSDAT